jgi:hypothetical protein
MHYNFIEIGTSDFDTLLETCEPNSIGLSIEPLKIYLDNLPDVAGVTKLNCAISSFDGEISVFWIDPEMITAHGLPDWIRGCNSVNKPHPTVVNLLSDLNLQNLQSVAKCRSLTWNTLVKEHNINSVDLLKIDTEGHDAVILNAVVDSQLTIFPKKIIFEKNELSNHNLLEEAIRKFKSLGYRQVSDDHSINQILEI